MFGIVANVASDRVLRTGAKVWLHRCNGDGEHPVVHGVSKHGRWVEKYTHFKRLTSFRAAWVPDHLRGRVLLAWPDRDTAQAYAEKLQAMWSDVRYFNRDGSVQLRAGITTEEAFRRLRRPPD